jgi:hypothetical protein
MQYFTTTFPDRARVLHYYDEMRKDNVSPSSHTYNILMQAYGTVEPLDLEAMHKVFDTMRQHAAEDRRIGTKAKDAVKVEGVHWATLINCHGAVNRGSLSNLPLLPLISPLLSHLFSTAFRPQILNLPSRSSTPSRPTTRSPPPTRTPSAGRPFMA